MLLEVGCKEPEYPQKIFRLGGEAPSRLFYAGDLSVLSRVCVAVVGSRSITGYGNDLINNYVQQLYSYNVTIISGFVRGVDMAVHKVGLLNSIGSVGVLGSSITSICNNKSSAPLFRENIAAGGLFISEYAGIFQGRKWSYVQRNRIIAALCDALLVVEAAEGSGSLITAQWAHKLNIPIYIFSYPLDSTNATGLAKIAKHMSANVIFELEPLLLKFAIKPKKSSYNCLTRPLEKDVLSRLEQMPRSFDALLAQSGQDPADLTVALMNLLTQGLIYKLKAKYYAKQSC